MEKIDKGLNWFDRALAIVDKYRFKTIFCEDEKNEVQKNFAQNFR